MGGLPLGDQRRSVLRTRRLNRSLNNKDVSLVEVQGTRTWQRDGPSCRFGSKKRENRCSGEKCIQMSLDGCLDFTPSAMVSILGGSTRKF